ncbi:FixH family protein [Pedobacter frigoris]|uniref:Nitrogen fixation protein FixH n=1 Tax=Pedobacter frigoris TaxID=2571272 RepID=A0A4U1CHN7_9SPHI|nr:FixH family protein [Pedobacter frigoris]TKC05941.1 nitrogen fixation protein FixH [Pedobacter frigoris]
MNWGTKLMIGMGMFMAFIVVLAVLMFNSKTDALVDMDYYEKGLNYDEEYNSKEQVKTDNAAPDIQLSPEGIVLGFKNSAVGNIRLMRVSDKKLDKKISFETNPDREFAVVTTEMVKGRWRLIISWNSEEKSYLYEQEVNLQ